MSTPPLAIGSVALTVHDLPGVSDYYERVVGLHRLAADGESATLGVGRRALLELRRDTAARRSSQREAGLFHTAFLLPTRGDLARWINHASGRRLSIQGASDHIVSEALYMADPEGNGIEIYADRPASSWRWENGAVTMATEALDFKNLMAEADGKAWDGAPEGATVGHVHLQVGSLKPAEDFYAGTLGFDVTCQYPGATFYSTGGYHHHLAGNIWNSRNAPVRQQPATGLSELELVAADDGVLSALRERIGGTGERLTINDPWGTPIAIRAES